MKKKLSLLFHARITIMGMSIEVKKKHYIIQVHFIDYAMNSVEILHQLHAVEQFK